MHGVADASHRHIVGVSLDKASLLNFEQQWLVTEGHPSTDTLRLETFLLNCEVTNHFLKGSVHLIDKYVAVLCEADYQLTDLVVDAILGGHERIADSFVPFPVLANEVLALEAVVLNHLSPGFHFVVQFIQSFLTHFSIRLKTAIVRLFENPQEQITDLQI